MRSVFGWSYPPGCSSVPGDEDAPCAVCGEFEDKCICMECPICHSIGYPLCYEKHGMIKSQDQILMLAHNEALWEEDSRNESRALEEQLNCEGSEYL